MNAIFFLVLCPLLTLFGRGCPHPCASSGLPMLLLALESLLEEVAELCRHEGNESEEGEKEI